MIEPDRARMVESFLVLAERELGPISGNRLREGWLRLQASLPGRLPACPLPPGSQRAPRAWRAWLAGFATASVVAALAFVAYRARSASDEPALGYALEGPATNHGGSITASTDSASRLRFSDQSRIDLAPSTNVTVQAVDARGARIALNNGALEVFVEPRPHASWCFIAGPFRVNVKGTRFHLAFAAAQGRLTLQMKSGLVEVLAPPHRAIAVGKNESLELFAEPGQAEASPPAPMAPSPAAPPVAAGLHPESAPPGGGRNPTATSRVVTAGESARHRLVIPAVEPGGAAPDSWPKLLAKGDFASVIADAERRGLANALVQASAADLSSLADAARYTRRYDLARQVLLALRARFVGADHARDASFFLGRLAEAVSDRFETALGWYETYLRESSASPIFDIRDADTCAVVAKGPVLTSNTTRGVAHDVTAAYDGAEAWTNDSGGVASATTGSIVDATATPSLNFLIYWDADESRELEDGTAITKYGGGTLQSCATCASNNGSKATPVLTADLFGDWREEIVWRETGNAALRIYTTTDLTARRLFTLMHDPQYRMQVSSEQTGFNQPPHPSFHLGGGMSDPPKPDIYVK